MKLPRSRLKRQPAGTDMQGVVGEVCRGGWEIWEAERQVLDSAGKECRGAS